MGASNSALVPCSWRNGALTFLPTGSGAFLGYVNAVALDASGNLFVAGDSAAPPAQAPCFWKNGALTLLPQSSPGPLQEGKRVTVNPR